MSAGRAGSAGCHRCPRHDRVSRGGACDRADDRRRSPLRGRLRDLHGAGLAAGALDQSAGRPADPSHCPRPVSRLHRRSAALLPAAARPPDAGHRGARRVARGGLAIESVVAGRCATSPARSSLHAGRSPGAGPAGRARAAGRRPGFREHRQADAARPRLSRVLHCRSLRAHERGVGAGPCQRAAAQPLFADRAVAVLLGATSRYPTLFKALRPSLLVDRGILQTDLAIAVVLVGVWYVALRTLGASAKAAAWAWGIAIAAPSFEGLELLWLEVAHGRPLGDFRFVNVDGFTRWRWDLPPVDSLHRIFWYTPQHATALTMGVLLIATVIAARKRGRCGEVRWRRCFSARRWPSAASSRCCSSRGTRSRRWRCWRSIGRTAFWAGSSAASLAAAAVARRAGADDRPRDGATRDCRQPVLQAELAPGKGAAALCGSQLRSAAR